MSTPFALSQFPVHLGLGATVVPQPRFEDPMRWYEDYGKRNASDGKEGRLVSMHTFSKSWDTWEMHPIGAELVLCTEGEMTLFQERDGETIRVTLRRGEAIINPPGVWHTADCEATCTALFITAGEGTEIRPR